MMKQKISFIHIISLLLVFLIYSSANIFMKLSSGEDSIIMSGVYFAFTIGVLGIYACLWQQILKHIPLTTAFMFKSITVLYGMFFAHMLFHEAITANNVIGALLIVLGIIILGWEH